MQPSIGKKLLSGAGTEGGMKSVPHKRTLIDWLSLPLSFEFVSYTSYLQLKQGEHPYESIPVRRRPAVFVAFVRGQRRVLRHVVLALCLPS